MLVISLSLIKRRPLSRPDGRLLSSQRVVHQRADPGIHRATLDDYAGEIVSEDARSMKCDSRGAKMLADSTSFVSFLVVDQKIGGCTCCLRLSMNWQEREVRLFLPAMSQSRKDRQSMFQAAPYGIQLPSSLLTSCTLGDL